MMKTYFRATLAAAVCMPMLGALWGCSGGVGNSGLLGAGATSQLCSNITGPLAIQYDVQNGVITTALTTIPIISTVGGNYIHPSSPLLGFIYPPGWTPVTIQDQQSFGVNLIRDDQQAIWRWISAQVTAGTSARALRDIEINSLLQFFGVVGPVETICFNEGGSTPAQGINLTFSSTIIQWDSFTAVIVVSTSFVDSVPLGTAFGVVAAGPSAEIDALIFNTFLPIHFQMLVGGGSSVDTDGDGISDTNDNFPTDPTRS